MIPIPPPEKVRLQSSSWNGQWTSGYIREQALQREAKLRRQRIRDNLRSGMNFTGEEDELTVFRRVHIVSYKGDLLKVLVEIGEKLRDLMIELSAHSASEPPDIPVEFEQRFSRILSDFDELRNTKIMPLLELQKRSAHDDRSRAVHLENWIRRTRQILLKAPFKGCREQIMKIRNWLTGEFQQSHCLLKVLITKDLEERDLCQVPRIYSIIITIFLTPGRSHIKP